MDNGASSYRRFLNGDERAFDELMEALFYSLVFFVDRYVQDIHTAEDIAMDVFADLLVHRQRYNFKAGLKTYLFMMGRSRALDHIKRRKKLEFVELSQAEAVADEGKDLLELVLADERKRRVNEAVARLPRDMAAAVHLVYFAQLTYEETARVMKKSRKQVDNLLQRAKKELRIILGEDGERLL